jgi:hypothetical protein
VYIPRFTILGMDPRPGAVHRDLLPTSSCGTFFVALGVLWRVRPLHRFRGWHSVRFGTTNVRAAFVGIPVARPTAGGPFVLSGAITGWAGALDGTALDRQVTPEQLGWFFSAKLCRRHDHRRDAVGSSGRAVGRRDSSWPSRDVRAPLRPLPRAWSSPRLVDSRMGFCVVPVGSADANRPGARVRSAAPERRGTPSGGP